MTVPCVLGADSNRLDQRLEGLVGLLFKRSHSLPLADHRKRDGACQGRERYEREQITQAELEPPSAIRRIRLRRLALHSRIIPARGPSEQVIPAAGRAFHARLFYRGGPDTLNTWLSRSWTRISYIPQARTNGGSTNPPPPLLGPRSVQLVNLLCRVQRRDGAKCRHPCDCCDKKSCTCPSPTRAKVGRARFLRRQESLFLVRPRESEPKAENIDVISDAPRKTSRPAKWAGSQTDRCCRRDS